MDQETAKYVIVGGGAAAAKGAQGVREVDPDGRCVIICRENRLPYDRPPFSKGFLTSDDMKPEDAESKDPSFYTDKNVEVRVGTEVTAIDRGNRRVTLSDGSTLGYEKLLLALGSTPRTLDVPGANLEGVHYLRTADDAQAIRRAMRSSRDAVMVGGGYIGMEVAASCASTGLNTSIVDPNDHPWSKFASNETGTFLKRYFEIKGVHMASGEEVAEIVGNRKVEGVKTKSGKELEADFVVIGVGVHLNLDLPKQAGLEVDEKNGVVVNEKLQSSDPNIYIAGDIAYFQDVALEKRWHAEHYLNATWQGQHAGKAMAGQVAPFDKVAYFFSDMFDIHMILRGDPQSKSQKLIGKVIDAEYIELYGNDEGTLRMGLAFSKDEKKLDPISDKLEELIRAKAKIADLNAASFS
jgi:3-phenylpropionate/trans-cinnamate dioxygenase ferredoxin reductase component